MGTGEGNTAVIAFYFYHIVFTTPTKLTSLTLTIKLLVPHFSEFINCKSYFQNLIYEITVFWCINLSISSRLEIDYILCCISSNKRPRRLLNFERLLEGGAYFKDREINNIKRQNFVIFSFKI